MSATVITKSEPEAANFTAFDRCDRNQSERANVEFLTSGGGTLLACSYHARQWERKIVTEDGGMIVRDSRPDRAV